MCWVLKENFRFQVKKKGWGQMFQAEGTGCTKALGSAGDLGARGYWGADLTELQRGMAGHAMEGEPPPLSFMLLEHPK